MTVKQMLIDPFRIEVEDVQIIGLLESLQNDVKSRSYEELTMEIDSEKSMRLDNIRREGNLWLLNFGLLKDRGPGFAENDRPIYGAQIGEGKYFAYETSMLYRPKIAGKERIALIEYVHRGVRVRRIADYFDFASNSKTYKFIHVFLGDPKDTAKDLESYKAFEFFGQASSLKDVIGKEIIEMLEQRFECASMKLEIRVIPDKSLRGDKKVKSKIDEIIDSTVAGEQDRVVIIGRNTDDEEWERINIFDPKERLKQDIQLNDKDDREAAPDEERWEALKRALKIYDRQNR